MHRSVIALVDDMFFTSKIRATAEALGVTINFPRSRDTLLAAANEQLPDLIVVNLHNEKVDPIELANELKSNERLRAVPLLGFFSHVQTDLQRRAVEAGYDRVIPRSVFANDLGKILSGEGQQPDR
jgi:PleD family two-component response regulator